MSTPSISKSPAKRQQPALQQQQLNDFQNLAEMAELVQTTAGMMAQLARLAAFKASNDDAQVIPVQAQPTRKQQAKQ